MNVADNNTEVILEKLLKEFSANGRKNELQDTDLTIHSNFRDVADYFDLFDTFNELLRNKQFYAPDYLTAISLFIEDAEKQIGLDKFVNEEAAILNGAYMAIAYWQVTKGKRTALKDIAKGLILFKEKESENRLAIDMLKQIGEAVVYAYELPRLKKFATQANQIKVDLPIIKAPMTKIFPWVGTPGEFGALFDNLFDKGFLTIIKDKATTVRQLNSIFDIRNENGEVVTDKYLYKCFGEKQRQYNPGQLKIPFSENYSKNK